MYQERIILTPEAILEKEFKIDTRGYRLQEVDKFLDIIIKDYAEFGKVVEKLEAKLHEVNDENMNLKNEIRNLKMNLETVKGNETESTSVDVLRRISHLEKVVYGKDL